jgi:hypothetical protein
MSEVVQATIAPDQLQKGQSISAEMVWVHYTIMRPEKLQQWIERFGDEDSAKLAKLPQVLLWVRDWVESERRQMELPPLVMHTAGGQLNVLDDTAASAYLNGQAYQGISRHRRATARLINAVDPNMLSGADRREHENRVNVHSFIASSTQGAQRQLRMMEQAGKAAPKLKGAKESVQP